ncbi:hypothetical protein DPQ33_00675 [Oceanidesulfovibrio indonesiensis]|uniref:Tryptophan-rich sensory protein n=1 Tax=Oceanidesulfovibrio indonesiensis TaxID=54767 RepID=A0A7M3MJ19_9BACT|nr:hypothetical protein [Oceanidesulfovibrio indonesiensis]TVM19784.1 hypothetical protein DPQ33_00675 [Oceanidesulfovibrio indonesiensis]
MQTSLGDIVAHPTRNQRNAFLAWTVVSLAVAQALVQFLPLLGLGAPVGVRASVVRTPLTPAGWTFAIWGLIYLWSFAYAVHQVLPGQRNDPLLASVRLPSALVFALSGLWVVVAQFTGLGFGTVLIIVPLLILLLVVLFNIQPDARDLSGRQRILLHWPFLLYAGWVSLATFANISSFLAFIDVSLFGLGQTGAAALLLLCAGAFCIAVERLLGGSLVYVLPVLWGLAGIAVANVQRGPDYWFAAYAVAMAGALAGFTLWTRKRLTRKVNRRRG